MLLSPELLLAVPLLAWRAFLRAHGVTAAPKSHDAVRAALAAAGPALAASVHAIVRLAGDGGRAALVEAARAFGRDVREWPAEASAPVLAVTLVTRAVAREPELGAVLEAATFRVRRAYPTTLTRRYAVAASGALDASPRALRRLASLLEAAGEARLAPGPVDVRVATREPHLVLDVARPDPAAAPLAVGGAPAPFVPLRFDRLTIERHGPRVVLRVATAAADLLPAYRAAVGEALFGDRALFDRARPVSLRALQRKGRAALDVRAAGSARLRGARAIALHWDPGREETHTTRGRDVLAALERDELPLEGLLISATLRLDFLDGPVDVILRVPHVVHWEPCPHDAAVSAFLERLGIDDDAPDDFIGLAPFDHPAWRWRAACGDGVFEALVARGLLARSTSRAMAHPAAPTAGRVALAFPLADGGAYAVPEEGYDAEARRVEDADLVTHRLDVLALAREVARGLELTGEVRPLERGALLDLGERAIAATRVRVFLVVGLPTSRALAERLRAVARHAHAVLLVPGALPGSGLAEVALPRIEGPYDGLAGEMARALGLEARLDARHRAPPGTRLIYDRETNEAWLDGVELAAVGDVSRALGRILADAGGRPVPSKECDQRLSSARVADGAAKQAKARLLRQIGASFEQAGRAPPSDLESIIESTRQGYRIAISCWVG